MSTTQDFNKRPDSHTVFDEAHKLLRSKVTGKRRNGSLSILHPHRVLWGFRQSTPNPTEDQEIACLLHDLLEDTKLTSNNLREFGFSEKTIEIVEALTRHKKEGELYLDFIRRVSHCKDAIPIKIADMQDNSSDLSPKSKHYKRYQLCIKYLEAVDSRKIKPGSSIEDALTNEEITENQGIQAILNADQGPYYTEHTAPRLFPEQIHT